MNQEQGYSALDFEQGIAELSVEARKRFYTYTGVSYATLEEIKPLLQSAKEWAYILHDKDELSNGEPRPKHYHVLLAYESNQTYRKLLKLVKSDQNTFIQGLKRCVGNIMDYFIHATEASKEKFQYDEDDIVYSDKDYWHKRLGWQSSEDKSETATNETFLEDLLSSEYDPVTMARKYGRDFIRNSERYEKFRNLHKDDDLKELKQDADFINRIEQLEYNYRTVIEQKNFVYRRYNECQSKLKECQSELSKALKANNKLEHLVFKLQQENEIYINIIKEVQKK